MSDSDYIAGQQSAYLAILDHAIKGLCEFAPTNLSKETAVSELFNARAALRGVFEGLDIMDAWDDHLYLSDLIRRLEGVISNNNKL